MELLNHCPACESDALDPDLQVKDFFGTRETFQLSHCNHCDLVFTNPRPDQKEIITYYKSNSYVSHGQSKGFLFDQIYRYAQKLNLAYKQKLIRRHHHGVKLLDYGCGAGAFLDFMKEQSFEVYGVEPDPEAREHINPKIPVTEHLNTLKAGDFDIITAYHVIEHVHDLASTLITLIKKLKTGGTLHIALPNRDSYDAKHYKSFWAGYDVPRHLYHFNQKSALQLFAQLRLQPLETAPMKLDSYYVSLLSENYSKSTLKLIKAFWHGYRSNAIAKRSSEFSSLIYILRKE